MRNVFCGFAWAGLTALGAFVCASAASASTVFGASSKYALSASPSSGAGFVATVQSFTGGDVWAVYRAPAGRLSAPERISVSSEHRALFAAVSANQQGKAVAVWKEQIVDNGSRLEVATRSATTGWSAPRILAEDADNGYGGVAVGMSRSGRAVVVWAGGTGVMAATASNGGNWSQPRSLSHYRGVQGLNMAIDDAGRAVAVWQQGYEHPSYAMAAVLRRDGNWAPARRLSPAGDVGHVSVAVNGKGAGLIAWMEGDGKNTNGIENASVFTRSISNGFVGGIAKLPDSTQQTETLRWGLWGSSEIAAAVDPAGRRMVAWSADNSPTVSPAAPQAFTAVSVAFESRSSWMTTLTENPSTTNLDASTPAIAAGKHATYVLWTRSSSARGQMFRSQIDTPNFRGQPVASVPVAIASGPVLLVATGGSSSPRLRIRPLPK